MINNCFIVNSPKYAGAKAALSDLLLSENAAVAAMVKNNGELHLAPNGRPSKLYADALEIGKQLKEPNPEKFAATIKAITLSEEFKDWFKDSKVIDENGEPLIVWHRSGSEFDTFDLSKSEKDTPSIGYHFGTREASEGVETLTDKSYLYPVFLNLKNPLECTDREASFPNELFNSDKLNFSQNTISTFKSFDSDYEKQERSDYIGKILRNLGYDGLTYINTIEDPGSRSFVVFLQDQMKSVQNTTFKDNKNIFYSKIYKGNYGVPIEIVVYAGNQIPYLQIEQFLHNSDLYYYFNERKPELLSFIQNIRFEVANTPTRWDDFSILEEFGNRPAYYNAATNTIRINPEAVFPADVSEVLWHEIFHALTVNQLAINLKAYEYFYDILKEYLNSGSSRALEFNGEHAVEEFVADIWANPEVISELKSIKTEYNHSLWLRIKNWIATYFGLSNRNSLFTKASAALDHILELPIAEGATKDKFFHSAAKNELNILKLLLYQYLKEGLNTSEIINRLRAYLQGDPSEVMRAKKFLDFVLLRRAELHLLGKDFGAEKRNPDGTINWRAYLHDIDLRTEIGENTDTTAFAQLKDYKIEPAEIIVPKIYKSNFKLGNLNLADIDVNYFKRTNPYYSSNLEKNAPESVDLLVRTHTSKFNIVFTDSFSDKEYTKAMQRVTPRIEDGWRLDTSGDRMYRLPEDLNYEICVDTYGEETILIKGKDEETVNRGFKLVNSVENRVSVQLFANNITPTDDIILDTISANNIKTNNTALRQMLKVPESNRKEALKQVYIRLEKQYKNDLANTLYNSFVKSLYMVSVRIPTQHFQSIMAAKVAALTNDEDNNVFVNRWQFWLQGSDLDIKL